MKIKNRKAPLVKKMVLFSFIFLFIIELILNNVSLFSEEERVFLNPGMKYQVLEKDYNVFKIQPPDTRLVIIDFKEKDLEYSYGYYVKGEIDNFKLQLIEYDFFTRIFLRNDIINTSILDMFNEQNIFQLHKRIYHHFHAFHNLKYPQDVSEIHRLYLEILETVRGFLDFDAGEEETFFYNSTILYRIIGHYNSYSNQKKFLQATLLLNTLLEENGIQPY